MPARGNNATNCKIRRFTIAQPLQCPLSNSRGAKPATRRAAIENGAAPVRAVRVISPGRDLYNASHLRVRGHYLIRPIGLALALLAATPIARASQYLYVWAMETHDPTAALPPAASMGRDFLAVFDVALESKPFGRLVAMLPVGERAQMAHHTNYAMPADGRLFASDYQSGRGYIFDLRDPPKPKLTASFGDADAYTHPHSFEYLSNGHTLATYQFKGAPDTSAGALVELDGTGHVVRTTDASDPDVEAFIRPYSMQVVPKLDRVVTTSADMLPADQSSHVVQVWRLSDLKLLQTVVLPKPAHYKDIVSKNANEARLLADGETVLVATSNCGLYRLEGLADDHPSARFVYDFGYRGCAVPVVVGRFWIQTAMSGHALVSLDVSDPSLPAPAGHLTLKDDALPHWIASEPGGDRLVITGFGWLATHALFATIDLKTGALALDSHEISFEREWPDGWNGPAMPHGAVFSNAPATVR